MWLVVGLNEIWEHGGFLGRNDGIDWGVMGRESVVWN